MNKSKLLNYLYYYIIKIKKILRLPITKSALSTLILIIPLLYELFNDIAIEYKLSLVLIVASINIYLVRNEIRKPDIRIEELLEMMIKTISRGDRKALGEYRANIMIYNQRSNTLDMKYHYNMMGSIDRDLVIGFDSGCCGVALKLNRPIWVDLEENPEAGYISDRQRIWGDMKSIISVPIRTNNGHEIVGILNVDSKNKVDVISQEPIYEAINMYSYIISKIL